MKKRICHWHVQTDIGAALRDRGFEPVGVDWHAPDWAERLAEADCAAYVWYPHLHHQWYELLDRAVFVETHLHRRCYPSVRTSYLFQDKLHQKHLFDLHRLAMPETTILRTRRQAREYFARTRFPVLLKDIWGYGGPG